MCVNVWMQETATITHKRKDGRGGREEGGRNEIPCIILTPTHVLLRRGQAISTFCYQYIMWETYRLDPVAHSKGLATVQDGTFTMTVLLMSR